MITKTCALIGRYVYPASQWILYASVWSVLLLAVALGAFCAPVYDDFFHAGQVKALGWADFMREWYMTTSGRWANPITNALVMLAAPHPEQAYPEIVGAFALFWAGASALLLRAVSGGQATWARCGAASALSIAVLWTSFDMSQPMETVYWISGVVSYQWPVALGMLTMAATGYVPRLRWKMARGMALMVLGMTAFYIAGLHEMLAMAQCGLLSVAVFGAWRMRSPSFYSWGIVLATAVVGMLVVFLAPGNFHRTGDVEKFGDVNVSLNRFWFAIGDVSKRYFLSPRMWAATALIITSGSFLKLSPGWLRNHAVLWSWLAPLAGVGCVLGWLAGPSLAYLSGRVLETATFMLMATWFISVLAWTRPIAPLLSRLPTRRLVNALAALILAWTLVTAPVTRNAFESLTTDVAAWRASQRERIAFARKTGHDTPGAKAEFPLLKSPHFFFISELTDDPRNDVNKVFALFFGLGEVSAHPGLTAPRVLP